MASGHHKAARQHWSPRSLWSPRLARLAIPVAAASLVTGTVVVTAGAWPEVAQSSLAFSRIGDAAPTVVPDASDDRAQSISRAAPRTTLEPKKSSPDSAVTNLTSADIVDHQFMTTALNVWSGPGEQFTLLDVLPTGTKVPVTGEVEGQFAEISYDGVSRWVTAAYLVDEKPQPEEEATGVTDAPCSAGSSVESGLTSNAVLVHRSVCANFPEVLSYGGLGGDSEHAAGLALDIMIPSQASGDAIAEWVRANSAALGASEVLWAQQIWTVQRSSEGWRYVEDRGSVTANHYDHVHVTVYG